VNSECHTRRRTYSPAPPAAGGSLCGGASWTEEIERGIDESQVVLALLTRGSYVSDICRAEQLRSLRKGKKVIPLLARPDADRPLHLETKNYRDFTRREDYGARFHELLQDMQTGKDTVVLKEHYRQTRYDTVPPLPRNYVERPEALVNLRNALITEDAGPSIALTALLGMGGIGKTILAQALSRDEVVQQAFPDGIVWTTVGKEAAHDLVSRMQEVRRALGDEPGVNEGELHCINRYRNLLREKAALVIVDDVWQTKDVEPFLAESPRSRLLFTTRDASIATAVGAEEHEANLLTEPQSRALLARWSGYQVDHLPAEALDLIQECGRLPLALSMTGAMLRGKPMAYWGQVLRLLRTADLARIKAQFPNYPHTDLLRAIQVSVDALDAQTRLRYLKLAVLLEDMAARPAVQQGLWGVNEGEALATAEQLIGLSLAQRDGNGIRLHDLQLDYVRAQWQDREALELIHDAIRLSSHVLEKDSGQFVPQMVGRLLPHSDRAAIREFTDSLEAGVPGPWLRPLRPALHPPGTALLRTLEGHTDGVNGVAVTADGRRAVSTSGDQTLKVWDLETDMLIATFTCDGAVNCCAFASNQTIVAGDAGGRVHFLALEGIVGDTGPVNARR
jgi:hypothetical protein